MQYIEDVIGNTPLVQLRRLPQGKSIVACKLEGNNPAGSIKDRPVLCMITQAEKEGRIRPGDTLIEATSGNTGIAYAMLAAVRGYHMILIMPENMTDERKKLMRAYGAQLILVSTSEGMEGAISKARQMESEGKGIILDQFANAANPMAHYHGTAEEIWHQTGKRVTHFVASTGTTGTLMGVSRRLKEYNPAVRIIGVHPAGESRIPGIRDWPAEYMPAIFRSDQLDELREVSASEAEDTMYRLFSEEGISAGPSSGGNVAIALQVARELEASGQAGVIVTVICDRGDKYFSSYFRNLS